MNNRYFLTILTVVPGKEDIVPTQCEMVPSPRGTLEENIAWARTETLEREGCDDATVTCVMPICASEEAEDRESRYAFTLIVNKSAESSRGTIILCERTFPHRVPTWDDLLDFQNEITKENGWAGARIIAANRLTDYDFDEDEDGIAGDYEGGGMGGTE